MNKDAIIDVLKRYPLATVAFVLLLVVLVIIFVRGDRSIELVAKEVELNAELGVLEANAKNAVNLVSQSDILEGRITLLDAKLFNPEERAVNTNFFYSLETPLNVRIVSVNPVDVKDPSIVKKGPNELKLHNHLIYELSITGSYQNILSFFKGIQEVDAFLRVTSIQVSPQGSAGDLYAARTRVVVLASK